MEPCYCKENWHTHWQGGVSLLNARLVAISLDTRERSRSQRVDLFTIRHQCHTGRHSWNSFWVEYQQVISALYCSERFETERVSSGAGPEREKFAPHVIVSAGVYFAGKGRLHLWIRKRNLIPKLIEDATALIPTSFKMAPQHILHMPRKADCTRTVTTSLGKTSSHRICWILIRLTTKSGAPC